jgi:hypothetical protein
MSRKGKVTIWSILALLVLLVGGGGTWLLSWQAVAEWARSGQRFAVGEPGGTVRLTPGTCYVYYESPIGVPSDFTQLYLTAEDGTRLRPHAPTATSSFYHGGVHGGALWTVEVPRDGVYSFICHNENENRTPDDRVVFGKAPQTRDECLSRDHRIKVAGLSVTGTLFVLLYVFHGVTLSRRSSLHSGQG